MLTSLIVCTAVYAGIGLAAATRRIASLRVRHPRARTATLRG